MSQKIEGTMILEGLIEGPVPPFPDAREKLERWARGFAGGAVRISLQVDGAGGGGGHFSALPSNEPVFVKQVVKEPGGDASFAIADSLSELLRFFPPLEKGQVFSTLRSVEYRHNEEVQTVYAVGPEGRAVTRQQNVACQTTAAEQPVAPREMVKRGAVGLVVAIAILGISSFFVDYRGIWRRMTARVEPVKVEADAGLFVPYFKVEVTGIDRRAGTLLLKLTRTAAYPRDEKTLDELYANPPEVLIKAATTTTAPATSTTKAAATEPAQVASLLRRRLAVESLAKGVIDVELLDKDGNVVTESPLRIDELERHESVETSVPVPMADQRPVTPASVRVVPE